MQQSVGYDSPMDTTVTSVGRRSQKLLETAAAVYVISQDDIRRSGATNIPDALRMAPGLEVARIDSNRWAVSSRGFNGRYANKLLVLMDGREVYSPTFGGVYWEVQDTPLHDIDRIEVIRGPGASLWGANAVNGVVNIITKPAGKTLGGRLNAGIGSYEKNSASFRYGHQFNESTAGRIWAHGFNRGSFDRLDGGNNRDDWNMARAGFRLDRDARQGDAFTLLGSAYSGDLNMSWFLPTTQHPYSRIFPDRGSVSGYNLLGRWKTALSTTSELSLQTYFDHTYRKDIALVEERDTFDLDLQHRFLWGQRQSINWGLGYRVSADRYGNMPAVAYYPEEANKQLFSAFLQDDISLVEKRLTLTLGSKLQHNDYTGIEGQPNIRLLWMPNNEHAFWGAVSRAVRIPTRNDDAGITQVYTEPASSAFNPFALPSLVYVGANRRFRAEEVLAYEVGYRFKAATELSLDVALFYNDYQSLRGFDNLHYEGGVLTSDLLKAKVSRNNGVKAQTYGSEWSLHWQVLPEWSLETAYTYLNTRFQPDARVFSTTDRGTSPQQQVSMRSALNLGKTVDFDVWFRYVDSLPLKGTPAPYLANGIPSYTTLDARLGWRAYPGLELSLVGQNLLDNRHPEFQQEALTTPRTGVPRSFYLKLDWQF